MDVPPLEEPAEGDKLYFVNLLEHKTGKGPSRAIPLRDVISGKYKAQAKDTKGDGIADRWINGDPGIGKFLEFRVKRYAGVDRSMRPADYVSGKKTMIPLPRASAQELANATHLRVRTLGGTPPEWEKWARKDMYRVGNQSESGASVEVAIRMREFAGTYVEHCHNTQHEDNSMLLRWDIEHPRQFTGAADQLGQGPQTRPMPSRDGTSQPTGRWKSALETFSEGSGAMVRQSLAT